MPTHESMVHDAASVHEDVPTRPGALSPAQEPGRPSHAILRDLLVVAAIGGGIWVAHRLGRIVFVLVLAMFFAYMIEPLVGFAQRGLPLGRRRRRVPRTVAIAIVYVMFAAVVATSTAIVGPSASKQLDAAVASVPAYTESFRAWEHGWSRYYERLRIPVELRDSIDQSMLGVGDAAVAWTRGSLLALLAVVSELPWLILVPVLSFLMLKDGAAIRKTILIALPHRVQLRSHRLFAEVNTMLAAYARAQLIACLIVGTLCSIGFALIGTPYPILLGAIAAVLEFIPLLGPLVLAAMAVTIATFHGTMLAVSTGAFLTVLRGVEDYVIYPRLISRDIHLHPLAVIVAVLAGADLGGVAGIFVAIPVLALLTVIGRHWLAWRENGGDDPSVRASPS